MCQDELFESGYNFRCATWTSKQAGMDIAATKSIKIVNMLIGIQCT